MVELLPVAEFSACEHQWRINLADSWGTQGQVQKAWWGRGLHVGRGYPPHRGSASPQKNEFCT